MGVVDSFQRLRHDAVVRGYDEYDDVSRLGSARAHAGKRFVTRGIEKHDLTAECRRLFVQNRYLVSADVLRDAASFAPGHVGQTNGVQ